MGITSTRQTQPAPPPDDQQRRRIVEELDVTMLVEAAAGTGKTTSMVARMVALIRHGTCTIDQVAAVTFTRKAAAELRARFHIELERAASQAEGPAAERLDEALGQIHRCFIGTIHSFCGRLLRERPIEAGLDLSFREIEPDEDFRLREQAWDDYVALLYAGGDRLLEELDELGLQISQLKESFLTFANYPDVEEWPGPQVELGDVEPARRELLDYLKYMRALVGTFPADRGNDQLMNTYERVTRLVRQRDLNRTADLMELLEEFSTSVYTVQKAWPEGSRQGKQEKTRWHEFSERVAQPVIQRWFERRYHTVVPLLQQCLKLYDQLRLGSGRLNYQDLLMQAANLLRDKPQVRQYFRRQFTHLLVDEFQDTDPIQAEVMMYLTADDPQERNWRRCRPVAGSLFVVGDPKQSIYRFRRADIVTYNQVKAIIKSAGGVVVSLTANFRSLEPLIQWGNDIFDRTFPPHADTYSPAASPMQAGRQAGSDGKLSGVRILDVPAVCKGKEDVVEFDSQFVARFIRQALDEKWTVPRSARDLERGRSETVQPDDFLIVTCRKANLAQYAQQLQRLGIPHQVTGSSVLGSIAELGLLKACLGALVEPENPVALLAVLRGELFGLSDAELFTYRRAGGGFHYYAPIPAGLDADVAQLVGEAFSRLQRYDRWLRRIPMLAAVERIAADLGLPMRAMTAAGGDVQVGSLSKAFQLLRAQADDLHSVTDIVARLETLIDTNVEFDGLPARAQDGPVVRLMNLHKVKGLEAPVVFLVDPTGYRAYPPTLHVDRQGPRVRGYLAIQNRYRQLAQSPGWQKLAAGEERFEQAEQQRLLYVAATRAGSNLIISRTSKYQIYNFWHFFHQYTGSCKPLKDPGSRAAPARKRVKLSQQDVSQACEGIQQRWQSALACSYALTTAKAVSAAEAVHARGGPTAEDGSQWGTVIHLLLQTAMLRPEADLHDLAHAALEEQGLKLDRADEAVQTVRSVIASTLWQRARAAQHVLVEVPLQTLLKSRGNQPDVPTLLRGVIDLAFLEPAGWVIADYKTDVAASEHLASLVDYYKPQVTLYAQLWQELIGAPVHEMGLFFTAARQYVTVEPHGSR